MDTIYALSTAPGKAGVAVIRISGVKAVDALRRLNNNVPEPREVALRVLLDESGAQLDEALVLVFEAGHSFTGEEVVELQCHGSQAVVLAILNSLARIDGLRPAEAGEFTRRALQNNRLDISQIEGLADLLEAETEAQRRQAVRVFSGDLGKRADGWRTDLIRAAALLEVTIDFADEELPVDVTPEVSDLFEKVIVGLREEIAGVDIAERIRNGFEVAILGAPNVGKSTLLNTLAGRDAAITSEYAGTTRDVIEVRMDLGGLPVTLHDTAGLRETDDPVENIGINRALERAKQADLRVLLLTGDERPEIELQDQDIIMYSKADLRDDRTDAISGKTGIGVTKLVERITQILGARSRDAGIATRLRHKHAMESALIALDRGHKLLSHGDDVTDLVAEEVRSAIRSLDSLVGRVDIENILDEIFASFCLGK